jgi:hypothetical protein
MGPVGSPDLHGLCRKQFVRSEHERWGHPGYGNRFIRSSDSRNKSHSVERRHRCVEGNYYRQRGRVRHCVDCDRKLHGHFQHDRFRPAGAWPHHAAGRLYDRKRPAQGRLPQPEGDRQHRRSAAEDGIGRSDQHVELEGHGAAAQYRQLKRSRLGKFHDLAPGRDGHTAQQFVERRIVESRSGGFDQRKPSV